MITSLSAHLPVAGRLSAEFALMRHWSKQNIGRAVYIAPFQELVDQRLADWQKRLRNIGGGKEIVKLTGETTADLKLLRRDLVLATPTQWDVLFPSVAAT
jgi:pre-mRNA-splicing helicase BRR2